MVSRATIHAAVGFLLCCFAAAKAANAYPVPKSLSLNQLIDEADFIVKGLRAVSDFETELQMAQMNKAISGVHTLFIPSASSRSFLASRLIREIARYGGDVSSMVPEPASRVLREKFAS